MLSRLVILILGILLVFCSDKNQTAIAEKQAVEQKAVFKISITLDRKAYHYTNFGEPPQMAIWLENQDRTRYIPVWVTHRSAHNDWKGKIECPVALPYWEQRKLLHSEKQPLDSYSGATPLNDVLKVSFMQDLTGKWFYFIEVNASADYNQTFSYWSKENMPDSEANGQPSLIYRGAIDFDNKVAQPAVLMARTIQFGIPDSLITDLEGISTARDLLKEIRIVF